MVALGRPLPVPATKGQSYLSLPFLTSLERVEVPNDVQRILFRLVDLVVVLIEVEDVGGDRRWFPTDVGVGFLYKLMDQSVPVYRSDSGNRPKQGIRHCDADVLWLL